MNVEEAVKKKWGDNVKSYYTDHRSNSLRWLKVGDKLTLQHEVLVKVEFIKQEWRVLSGFVIRDQDMLWVDVPVEEEI